MQRLKVSGAVRPIYGSLGVKRLMKVFLVDAEMFHADEQFGSEAGRTKLIVAIRNFAKAPEKGCATNCW